ncbi:hypothetical protein [Mycolicibacterium sphagni]|uniref:hypothetical protein n=1 Tax=Mycolicibacterium sphagni TaxID=1786 RepID=UPI0021F386CC|nr:hypothetical protein [Mycolicibacterium sphagni]MCV7174872.1 hypothetical protein [Mycolicibacterium sphagni]
MPKYQDEVGMGVVERDAKIVELRNMRKSYRDIGKVVGLSANGVMHALRRIEEGRTGEGRLRR